MATGQPVLWAEREWEGKVCVNKVPITEGVGVYLRDRVGCGVKTDLQGEPCFGIYWLPGSGNLLSQVLDFFP